MAQKTAILIINNNPNIQKLALHHLGTNADQRIFRVWETILEQAGALTFLDPQWLPGTHSPRGPRDKTADLQIHAGKSNAKEQELAWMRDTDDVYTFYLTFPKACRPSPLNTTSCRPPIALRVAW